MAANKGPGFTKSDRQNNAKATAAMSASANVAHRITTLYCAFSGAATKTVVIKDGSTAIHTFDVVNSCLLTGLDIAGTAGNAVSAELAASGSAGVYGSVCIAGESE